MKVRHIISVGVFLFAGIQAHTVFAMPQFAKVYTYYDADGLTVGYKYLSCDAKKFEGGEITGSYDIEEFPCGMPLPDLPICDGVTLYPFCIN